MWLWVWLLAVGAVLGKEERPLLNQARPTRGLPPRHLYARDIPAAFAYSGHLFPSIYSAPVTYFTPVNPLTAAVELQPFGDGNIRGRITFVQPHPPAGPVFMSGNVTGLTPGKHGLHIHNFGDTSDGCQSMGAHYNPHLVNHGGPADPYRHVGDLGNIEANAEGVGRLEESDHIISLVGAESILGRGLVIHEKADDLGRGGDMESLRTGNAGGRVACGVVAWAQPATPPPPTAEPPAKPEA